MKNTILRFIVIIGFLILSNNVFSQTNKRDTVITINKQDTIKKEKPRRHLDDDGSTEGLKKAQDEFDKSIKDLNISHAELIIAMKAYQASGCTDLFTNPKYAESIRRGKITPEELK